MNDKTKSSKNKNKRLADKETLEAEAERSIAVARMKQAHKLIEDTEKLRKRSAILSICKRVSNTIESADSMAKLLFESTQTFNLTWKTATGNIIQQMVRTYESIRYDLKRTMNVKDDDFEKLFPEVEINIGTFGLAGSSMLNICEQLKDIRIFCERFLQ